MSSDDQNNTVRSAESTDDELEITQKSHKASRKESKRSKLDYSDEDDEDEDEDDEEEEEEENAGRNKKKRRKTRSGHSQFLDVEAEVDDDEEDVFSDEDELHRDGFIQSDDEDVEIGDSARHRRVDHASSTDRFTDEDAQRLADEYREKYGRNLSAGTARTDAGYVPQRLLLPSVHDPSIFGINCRIGKEKEAVRAILRKKLSLEHTDTKLEIFSVFQRDSFPGRIYIEAFNQRAAVTACKGVVNVYSNSKILLVPIKEYPDMFRVKKSTDQELIPGSYVRVKRGKYSGDLAVVENLSESGLEAQLRLMPRLDYGRAPVIDSLGQVKKKRTTAADRPPQRLFSSNDAGQYDPQNLQRRGPHSYVYGGEEYENGYLIKDFKIAYLVTDGVNPTLEEITKLTAASDEGIDLQSLSESFKKDLKAQSFQAGEQVEIVQGELMGMHGKVLNSNADIVKIRGQGGSYKDLEVSVPAGQLRKHFALGDHVRVTHGNYKDDTGMVVHREKDHVTLLSDITKTEVTVFAKDLKMASDIGGSNSLGKYALNDLIQLNAQTVGVIVDIERENVKVLTQTNEVIRVPVSSIIMKVTSGRRLSTDQYGRQIEVGDTVRETSGENRQGTILHLHNQYVFMHNRELTENLGVFVNRITSIATVSTKGARDEKGLDLSRMNPNSAAGSAIGDMAGAARSTFNARRAVGQKVQIGGGSGYKGMRGLVKDVNDTSARVELEARNKIITVDVKRLLFIGQNGRVQSFDDFMNRSRGFRNDQGGNGNMNRNDNRGPRPGSNGGGRTPAWAGTVSTPANQGGRTPAWAAGNGDGGRTPAWSADNGGRTPAWNAGSKTPAWNAGAATPAWNAGAQTPAWNSGAQTPAWNSGAGSSSGGNKTPSWNSGSRTPAWNSSSSSRSAPTPGAGFLSSNSAPTPGGVAETPGFYDSAPTPGPISAPTPGAYPKTPGVAETPAAWGDDDDDESP